MIWSRVHSLFSNINTFTLKWIIQWVKITKERLYYWKGHKRKLEREECLRYWVRNRTIPTVVSGWILARTDGKYAPPFPTPNTILRKTQISNMTNLYNSMVLSLVEIHKKCKFLCHNIHFSICTELQCMLGK